MALFEGKSTGPQALWGGQRARPIARSPAPKWSQVSLAFSGIIHDHTFATAAKQRREAKHDDPGHRRWPDRNRVRAMRDRARRDCGVRRSRTARGFLAHEARR